MRISITVKLTFALFFCFNLIGAISVDKRSESKCGLLGDSIYCFGGLLTGALIDGNLYSLKITDFPANKSMVNLAKGWNLVQPTNMDYVPEPRRRANAAVFNNNNSLLITGGYTYNQTLLQNQTIVYHANTNTWETLSSYADSQGRTSQIYNSAVTSLVPNENSIAFYGGNTENPTFNESGVPIQMDSSNQTVMHQGYISLTLFNFDSKQWQIRSPQTNTPTNVRYSAGTATFNPRDSLIYYLGGFYSGSNDYSVENKVTFSTSNVFDTKSGAWSVLQLGGKVPSNRMFPTATLMPNSNDILLYGGTDSGTTAPFADFCYTLNLASNTWKFQAIDVGGVNSPPRFAHSAVLVNNSLFIMFGLATYNNPLSDIIVLSVKDVNNLYFPDTYPYIEKEMVITDHTTNTTNNGIIAKSLTPGEVAGIAIACIVTGLGICAGVIFFYIRKKKQNAKKLEEMYVDWDQVENFYTEQPASSSNHLAGNEKFVPMGSIKDWHPSPSSPSAKAAHSNPNEYGEDNYTKESSTVVNSEVYEDKMTLVKPSVVHGDDQRYVNATSQPAIIKPDHAPQ